MMDVQAKLKNLSIGINFCEFKKEFSVFKDNNIQKLNDID
jgi:hypothetical protein